MQVLIAIIFLSLWAAMLAGRVQEGSKKAFTRLPGLIFPIAVGLSAIFAGIEAGMGAWSPALAGVMLVYTLIPSTVALAIRRKAAPAWGDFAIILLLWLPLEFSIGAKWTPRFAQGSLHMAAYGVSVTLGLVIFLGLRRLEGMKYKLPRRWSDARNLALGFAIAAVVLIPLGRAIGFLEAGHGPRRWTTIGFQYVVIFAATALPEEILFRGLIQNSLMQKLGRSTATLILAALIFGCAHLDNGPGPEWNWRYMIVATVAGVIYGKVFEKSSSVFASAGLHALVNTVKHSFF